MQKILSRTLVVVSEGEQGEIYEQLLDIPTSTAIILVETCGTCDWCSRSIGNHKPFCDHPRAKAKRPFIKPVDGNGRKIDTDTRPDWCPLEKKNV